VAVKTIVLLFVSGIALSGCGRSGGNTASAAGANNGATAPAANQASVNAAVNAAAPAPTAAGAITPDQFRAMLRRDGARKTVQTLDADPGSPTLGQVYDGISQGNDQWLALVPLLSTGTDASTSEGLLDAVREALPHNAAGVLRVLEDRQTDSFLKEDVCGAPEMQPGPELTAHFTSATRAVEAVSDPALQAAKTRCLTSLRQAQEPAGR
jgi:hypothetical protein